MHKKPSPRVNQITSENKLLWETTGLGIRKQNITEKPMKIPRTPPRSVIIIFSIKIIVTTFLDLTPSDFIIVKILFNDYLIG